MYSLVYVILVLYFLYVGPEVVFYILESHWSGWIQVVKQVESKNNFIYVDIHLSTHINDFFPINSIVVPNTVAATCFILKTEMKKDFLWFFICLKSWITCCKKKILNYSFFFTFWNE